ncbi:non-specific phospholipase C1 [Selaginella moellendorffii]|uniref:non-specific phospholipase C1 n=1 Tax=Selaginella moellendorffii TaxID=88036 RepID=UPI000D1C7D6D|nr:non-specific phospholipase C1 [Selaginella moellendorffii]|eukprot:XP_024534533.1 non-specific phospholipase C1 [Selaginella moellendorffii]
MAIPAVSASKIVVLWLLLSWNLCLAHQQQWQQQLGWRQKKKISGPIKTVVVLVMENRSFDHMLGWLKKLNPEIDGLQGNESNPLSTTDPASRKIFVADTAEFVDPDPGHSFQAITEQVFGSNDTSAIPPPMNGFAQQAESMVEGFSETVMKGFRPELVPVYTALAMEFAVFDRWFASTPTSTQPNRLYVHSATSYGEISNVKKDLVKGFPQKTIYDSLDEDGLSFGIYYQNIPACLFFKNLRKLKYLTKYHSYRAAFKLHARLGMLPNVAVIEQRYFDLDLTPANDDHPSHDVSEGQKLVKEVYEALRSSPQWNEVLFVITYDEHGGFYDHVPTPNVGVPNPDGVLGPEPGFFDFDRLGVRVPTIMVSPWIEKGTVVHEPNGPTPTSQFEHSSLAATIKKLFDLKSDFLTKRDAWAGTFESVVSGRSSPRTDCPETLPTPPWSLRHRAVDEDAKLTEFQEELVQLASQLNGDHRLNGYPNFGKGMSVRQANNYVESAVRKFLDEGRLALKSGGQADDTTMLDVNIRKSTV